MVFSGFNVTPVGDAVLTVTNGILTVSNIGSTGLDGVLIELTSDSYTVNFAPLVNIKNNNGVFKQSRLAKNTFGLVVPTYEMFKWYEASNDTVVTGFNATFLPPSYDVFGKLSSASVFNINNGTIGTSPDPDFPPPQAFWGIVVAAVAVVATVFGTLYSKTTTTTTTTYDANGKLTGTTETITNDPVPFPIEVNGNTYTVDEYGIEFTQNVPPGLIGYPSIETHAIGHLITGTNLSSFDIISII